MMLVGIALLSISGCSGLAKEMRGEKVESSYWGQIDVDIYRAERTTREWSYMLHDYNESIR